MESVYSLDGTRIAYNRSGMGPPLVLVHGTGGSHVRWSPILPALEPHFTVYAVDRRGRGESGDAHTYAYELEFKDIAAVLDSIGQPAQLLGHSFGAICSLEAALLSPNLGKLILYEPPIPVAGIAIYPEGLVERLQVQLDAGEPEQVLTIFFREVVKMPAHEFDLLRASPAWPARVAAAHTLARELLVAEQYHFEARRFAHLTTPTLLLLGGDSPSFFGAAIHALASALPTSQTVVLPGQQHIAIDTAPELFAREVLGFLGS